MKWSSIAVLVASLSVGAAGAAGCTGAKGGPTMNNKVGGDLPPPVTSSVVSADVLAREPIANVAQVKHILISWNDLADAYQGQIDPRAAKRDKPAAEAEVKQLVEKLKAGGDFDALMKEFSEDRGSAMTQRAYQVSPDAQLVIEFRQIGLRLRVGEFGVVQSDFGFHIVKRVE